ncbi:hypothetical protein J6590_083033, partial [Homalodisca vitripennis]
YSAAQSASRVCGLVPVIVQCDISWGKYCTVYVASQQCLKSVSVWFLLSSNVILAGGSSVQCTVLRRVPQECVVWFLVSSNVILAGGSTVQCTLLRNSASRVCQS